MVKNSWKSLWTNGRFGGTPRDPNHQFSHKEIRIISFHSSNLGFCKLVFATHGGKHTYLEPLDDPKFWLEKTLLKIDYQIEVIWALYIYIPWKSNHHFLVRLVSEFHHYFSRGLSSSKRNHHFFNGGWLPGYRYIFFSLIVVFPHQTNFHCHVSSSRELATLFEGEKKSYPFLRSIWMSPLNGDSDNKDW